MAKTETLYSGDYLHLQCKGTWEFVQRANARGVVLIIAVTPDDELLLVEQHRPAVGAPVIELPAGLVGDIAGEEDESFAVAAARELEEETGYRAAKLEYLTHGPVSAGMSNETVWVYRARDLSRVGDGGGDDTEDITVHAVAMAAVEDWLDEREAEGRLLDPKLFAGLYFIRREHR